MKRKLKFLLLSALLLICGGVDAQVTQTHLGIPYSELGFKGNILSLSGMPIGRYPQQFVLTPGYINAFSIGENDFIVTGKTETGYDGQLFTLDLDCKFTVQNGKLTKISYQGESGQWTGTFTFTYANDAVTVKENSSRTYKHTYWVDYSVKADDIARQINELNEWYQAQYMKNYYNYSKLNSLNRQFEKKLNKLNEQYQYYSLKGGEYKTETKTDKSNKTFKYYDFKKDEVGNVVSYSMSIDDEHVKDIELDYVYEPNYIGEFFWNKLKESTDINDLEAFYHNTKFSDKYRELAQKRWNELVASKLEGEFKTDVNKLVNLVGKRIISENNRARTQELISEYYYPQAIKIRDFQELKNFVSAKTKSGVPYFNQVYRNKLMALSNQLRTDSIAYLNDKAKAEIDCGDFKKAISTTAGTLAFAPYDETANNLAQDGYYKLVQKGVAEAQPDTVVMKKYLQLYPAGKYKAQVEDEFVTSKLDILKACKKDIDIVNAGGVDMINYLRSLPVNDPKLARKVKNVTDKKEFTLHRGDVLDFGIGVSAEYGPDMAGLFGEMGFRVGYLANWVNLYVGGRFGSMTSMTALVNGEKALEPVNGGHFSMLRASVPVQVRLHVAKDYDHAWYVGLGADLTFNISPKIKVTGVAEKSHTNSYGQTVSDATGNPFLDNSIVFKDKNLVNKMTISPRLSLGYTGRDLNFEIYGLYDLNDTFNKAYLEDNGIENLVHPQFYEKQVGNKWRVGLALRWMF